MQRALFRMSSILLLAGGFTLSPTLSWSEATLNGFQLHSEGQTVTVTLDTDAPVEVQKENADSTYTLILPNTKVSPELLKKGLPVVIDKKRGLMGRAVPASNGSVKVVLPNVPTDQFGLSVKQKLRSTPQAPASSPVLSEVVATDKEQPTLEAVTPTASSPLETSSKKKTQAASTLKPSKKVVSANTKAKKSQSQPKTVISQDRKQAPTEAPVKAESRHKKPLTRVKNSLTKAAKQLTSSPSLAPEQPSSSLAQLSDAHLEQHLASVNEAILSDAYPFTLMPLVPVARPVLSSETVRQADWLAPYVVEHLEQELGIDPSSDMNQTTLPWWVWLISVGAALAVARFSWLLVSQWLTKHNQVRLGLQLDQAQLRLASDADGYEKAPRSFYQAQPNTYAPMTMQRNYEQVRVRNVPFSVPKPPSAGPGARVTQTRSDKHLIATAPKAGFKPKYY